MLGGLCAPGMSVPEAGPHLGLLSLSRAPGPLTLLVAPCPAGLLPLTSLPLLLGLFPADPAQRQSPGRMLQAPQFCPLFEAEVFSRWRGQPCRLLLLLHKLFSHFHPQAFLNLPARLMGNKTITSQRWLLLLPLPSSEAMRCKPSACWDSFIQQILSDSLLCDMNYFRDGGVFLNKTIEIPIVLDLPFEWSERIMNSQVKSYVTR